MASSMTAGQAIGIAWMLVGLGLIVQRKVGLGWGFVVGGLIWVLTFAGGK